MAAVLTSGAAIAPRALRTPTPRPAVFALLLDALGSAFSGFGHPRPPRARATLGTSDTAEGDAAAS